MQNIKNITVIGLGLIGGSLAISLKNIKNDFIITGFDNDPETVNIALYRNIIDKASYNYKDSVKDADIIIIATPVRLIVDIVIEIKDYLKKNVIITDVGSAKTNIVEKIIKCCRKM